MATGNTEAKRKIKKSSDATKQPVNKVTPVSEAKLMHEGIEVVNKEAYNMWLILEGKKTKLSKFDTERSDGTKVELNIGMMKVHLYKILGDFPHSTQEEIKTIKTEYDQLRAKATNWKMKAFGMDYRDKMHKTSAFYILKNREREIIELFGRMFSIDEVHQFCVEEWGIPVSKLILNKFRQYKIDEISTLIERSKAGFDDIRLGHKRPRIEELCWLYKFAKENLNKTRQIKYADLARNLLKDIKSEVEGDKLIIEGNLDINVDMTIHNHLANNVLRNIGLRQIIIGRVAAANGISPFILVEQLTTSYYSKFSGVIQEPIQSEYNNIEYPNDQPYDFDYLAAVSGERTSMIKSKNEEYRQEVKLLDAQGKELSIKEKLMNIIKEVEQESSLGSTGVDILSSIKFGK